MGVLDGKVALRYRGGARAGQVARAAARRGGRRHHRDRRLRDAGVAELPAGQRGGPGADRQGGRGGRDRPADRRPHARTSATSARCGPRSTRASRSSAAGWTSSPPTRRIISRPVATWEIDLDQCRELIDVTLTGMFVTIKAAVPHMIAAGNGGSIALTRSGAALISGGGFADYKAAKSGVLSLTRTLACELAEHFIRVNAICPTAVDTPMIQNETLYRSFRPRPAEPGPRGREGRIPDHEPAAHPVGGRGRRVERDRLAGLGRGPVHHRRDAARRRGEPAQMITTQAAVLWQSGTDWKVEEITLDEPRQGEVLVRVAAAGLCHSEEHHVTGDVPFAAPMIGGHEGQATSRRSGPASRSPSRATTSSSRRSRTAAAARPARGAGRTCATSPPPSGTGCRSATTPRAITWVLPISPSPAWSAATRGTPW